MAREGAHQDGAGARRPDGPRRGVLPQLPRQPAASRMPLRAGLSAFPRGVRAHHLRQRHHGGRRRAGDRLLVLLLLQRLRQQARGRLGDDPGPVGRRLHDRGGAPDRPDAHCLLEPRRRRAVRVDRQEASKDRRNAPGGLRDHRFARLLLFRGRVHGGGEARPGLRLRSHDGAAPDRGAGDRLSAERAADRSGRSQRLDVIRGRLG